MTDRVIAAKVALDRDDISMRSFVDSFYMVRHVEMRVDDFEIVDKALHTFGVLVIEKIIFDGQMAMDFSTKAMEEKRALIDLYSTRKPLVNQAPDIKTYVARMLAWSRTMDKVVEIE